MLSLCKKCAVTYNDIDLARERRHAKRKHNTVSKKIIRRELSKQDKREIVSKKITNHLKELYHVHAYRA